MSSYAAVHMYMHVHVYTLTCAYYYCLAWISPFLFLRISPTLMARSLMKRNNHSFLHVSGSSTPDWTLDDEQDELTDKVQLNNAWRRWEVWAFIMAYN